MEFKNEHDTQLTPNNVTHSTVPFLTCMFYYLEGSTTGTSAAYAEEALTVCSIFCVNVINSLSSLVTCQTTHKHQTPTLVA